MSLLLLLRPDYETYIPASFHGGLDEAAWYRGTALSAADIKRRYDLMKGLGGAYSNEILSDVPTAYYRLADVSGPTAVESSGNPAGPFNGTYSVSGIAYSQPGGIDAESVYNTVALYFRHEALDLQTQLDIDGETQATLDAKGAQPDFDIAKYDPRTQAELNIETQGTLSGDSQFDLERMPDYLSAYFIEVKMKWSALGGTLTLKDSNGAGYTYTVPAFSTANPFYYFLAELEDDTIRVRIYESDEAGSLMEDGELYNEFFDTLAIKDPAVFGRRKGRFGWYARFADGDAAIENIRPRSLNFGEVVTKPLDSISPVEGASLDVGASPDRVLFNSIPVRAPWGGVVTLDSAKTSTGKAVRVETSGKPMEGVMTAPFTFDDFGQIDLDFDILFPSLALTDSGFGVEAFLYGEFARFVPLNIGGFSPDRWQHLNVTPPNDYFQPGEYQIVLVQTTPIATTWWVDNFLVKTRSVEWSGRGHKPDPWGMEEEGWVPFRDTVNRQNAGVVFGKRGNELQIRGRSRRHDSYIDNLKATPKYAELARFFWPDEHSDPTSIPNAVVSAGAPSGQKVTFTGTSSTCTGGTIMAHHWSFGDGTEDFGPVVVHKYKRSGSYAVTLTVIDNNGVRDSASTSVSV